MVHLFQSFTITIKKVNVPVKLAENSRTGVSFRLKADHDNTGTILIGGSNPTYPMKAGEAESELALPLLDECFVQGDVLEDKLICLVYEDPHIHAIRQQLFASYGQLYLQKMNVGSDQNGGLDKVIAKFQ